MNLSKTYPRLQLVFDLRKSDRLLTLRHLGFFQMILSVEKSYYYYLSNY